MADKERMDAICKDSIIALERAKTRLNNATIEYLYAVRLYNDTVLEYLNAIQDALEVE